MLKTQLSASWIHFERLEGTEILLGFPVVDADQDGNWLKGTISPFFPPLHIDFSESFRIRKKRLKCNKTGDGKSRDTVACKVAWTRRREAGTGWCGLLDYLDRRDLARIWGWGGGRGSRLDGVLIWALGQMETVTQIEYLYSYMYKNSESIFN